MNETFFYYFMLNSMGKNASQYNNPVKSNSAVLNIDDSGPVGYEQVLV